MKGLTGIDEGGRGKACADYWQGAELLLFIWFFVSIIAASGSLCDIEAKKSTYSVTASGEKKWFTSLMTFNVIRHLHIHLVFMHTCKQQKHKTNPTRPRVVHLSHSSAGHHSRLLVLANTKVFHEGYSAHHYSLAVDAVEVQSRFTLEATSENGVP